MSNFSVLILAAGEGTRMKSGVPKVLHSVCEVPMVLRVAKEVSQLQPVSMGVVVGSNGRGIIKKINEKFSRDRSLNRSKQRFSFIRQKTPKGSGHAVKSAVNWIRKISRYRSRPSLLVLCADTPLIRAETLRDLFKEHSNRGNAATVCTMTVSDPFGYGRIIRDAGGKVHKIVEEKDASDHQRKIREVNTGIYCFDVRKLLSTLPQLKNNNAKREYYLTDVIELLSQDGISTGAYNISSVMGENETMGINDRGDLAEAERIFQQKILKKWMKEGVTILNPMFTYVGEEVRIGADTVLLPGTMLMGKTKIGRQCKIGPNTYIEDSDLGAEVQVRSSYVYGSKIGNRVQIGPFSHLRPGTVVSSGARIGNFSEIKNSTIGSETKVSHLAYIGDSTLGSEINVGAGAITCNFDGKNKHKTTIGSKSFIGSNANLIAPVNVGARSVVGAGSTVTKDVPPDSLAIERSIQVNKQGWTKKKKNGD